MQPNKLQDSTTFLTYSLTTSPMPVQVSPSATVASVASLTFVVSCPRSVAEATVAQIIIALPVDPKSGPADPTNLAEVAPLLSSASISSSGADEWIVEAGAGSGVFVFTPKTATVLVSGQSLTIEFTGIEVNTVVGTALVKINEWAAKGTGTPPPVTDPPSGVGTFAVAKFPYGFFAGNFTADQPMIANGQQPTLSWTGSTNAKYVILYEGNAPVDVSNLRTWSPTSTPPSPVLTHTTTFILQVSAQVDGQTATIDFNITIEVDKPSLVANDLTVLTTSNLQGAVTVGSTGTAANLAVNGDVQANGNLTVAQNLDVKAAATLESNLNVTGTTALSGSVGIGTPTPGSLLDVNGTTQLRGAPDGTGLTVTSNGNVGIGTTTPGAPLNVDPQGAGGIVIGNSSTSSGGFTSLILSISAESGGYSFLQSISSSGSAMGNLILLPGPGGGNVGIGTTTPAAPLHVASVLSSVPYGQICDQYLVLETYQWNSSSSNSANPPFLSDRGQTSFPNTAILAEGAIAAPVFYSFGWFTCGSDARMKNVEGISDGAKDLRTLLDIEITNFRYKDVIGKGSAPHKKLIAQQVEKVFPQAVIKRTDVVPDIYQPASCTDGWIALSTDLKKGERVRLISGKDDAVYEVVEVTAEKFRTDFKPEGDKVFVFGREVNDFRTLDYDAIAMLNVSATQELKKEKDEEVKALRAVCAELQAANDALLKRLELLESKTGDALKVGAAKAAAVSG